MAESKPEIKYFIPEININIDDNNPKDSPSGLNKLFAQIKNIENMHNNSLIMTEVSNSKIPGASQIFNSSFLVHQGIKY